VTIHRFYKDDAAYESWLREHPSGFVFNYFKGGEASSAYNIIHQASCSYLNRSVDEGRRTRVEKVCSDDLDELKRFADRERGTERWDWCKVCFADHS
jgi:hypothetical protein